MADLFIAFWIYSREGFNLTSVPKSCTSTSKNGFNFVLEPDLLLPQTLYFIEFNEFCVA